MTVNEQETMKDLFSDLEQKDPDRVSFLQAKPSNIPVNSEVADRRSGFVFWGKDNLYPQYLNYLFEKSAIHSGIIRAKRQYIVSGGLTYEGPDNAKWEQFKQNGATEFSDKDLNAVVWDDVLYLEKSNMICLRLKFNEIGARTLRRISSISFDTLRFEFQRTDQGDLLTGRIGISANWADKKCKIKILEKYDAKNTEQRDCYIMWMEEPGSSIEKPFTKHVKKGIYPEPPYGGAITAIDTGIEISKYNNAEVHNGFAIGTIVNLNNGAIADEEKKKKFESQLRGAATGADQAGGIMLLYQNGKDKEASVVSLNGNNLADRYMNAKKEMELSIVHGHSITSPILFGVKTEGSLGNATELETAYAIMKANYFGFKQQIVSSIYTWIANKIYGLQGKIYFKDEPLNFEQVDPNATIAERKLSTLSPLVANKSLDDMTPNERRDILGLPPIVGGDTLPSQAVAAFSAADERRLIGLMSNCGRDKSKCRVLFRKSLHHSEPNEQEFIAEFQKEKFALNATALHALNLISQGNNFTNVRKALGISSAELAGVYQSLIKGGLISSKGQLMDAGASEIARADIERMEILYEYTLRADAPELLPGGKSRPFCEKVMSLKRLYTLAEIQSISAAEGYDVFAYRGGWYHNWEKNRNEPGCRHEWSQVIVFK